MPRAVAEKDVFKSRPLGRAAFNHHQIHALFFKRGQGTNQLARAIPKIKEKGRLVLSRSSQARCSL